MYAGNMNHLSLLLSHRFSHENILKTAERQRQYNKHQKRWFSFLPHLALYEIFSNEPFCDIWKYLWKGREWKTLKADWRQSLIMASRGVSTHIYKLLETARSSEAWCIYLSKTLSLSLSLPPSPSLYLFLSVPPSLSSPPSFSLSHSTPKQQSPRYLRV